ncbi:MAG: PilZ domain-containing protein [Oscillospiraceae bacterium]|nr:PilZ domain-containing protein [Oscillospiraceae bacterium]
MLDSESVSYTSGEWERELEFEAKIDLSANQVITIEEKQAKAAPDYDPAGKYAGKFLYKKGNVMTAGICVESAQELEYRENEIVYVSYVEAQKTLFGFTAKILGIREASPKDGFDIEDMTSELGSLGKYSKYIFELIPTSGPERHQRREFYRMPLSVDIYYKVSGILKIELFISGGGLKYDAEKSKEAKKAADEGVLETEKGYLKFCTDDLSAGGFKYRGKADKDMDEGTFLECMLIVNDEGLPAVAQILSLKRCGEARDQYEVRALFHKISDPVRDKIVRYIFAWQRQPGLMKKNTEKKF